MVLDLDGDDNGDDVGIGRGGSGGSGGGVWQTQNEEMTSQHSIP